MRTKKAGLASKLVILILFLAVSLGLLSVRTQLQTAQKELEELEMQVQSQIEINAGLEEDIANRDDPEKLASIARERLGLVEPGERVFANTSS